MLTETDSDNEICSKVCELESKTIQMSTSAASGFDAIIGVTSNWIYDCGGSYPSLVASFCSEEFSQRAKSFLCPTLVEQFKRMLSAISLAHAFRTTPRFDKTLSIEDLRQIGFVNGKPVILQIETMLAPHTLSTFPFEKLRATLFIILGTLLAAAYSPAVENSPKFPLCIDPCVSIRSCNTVDDSAHHSKTTLWQVMQEHLTLTLGHYVLLLAGRLGIKFPVDVERAFLSTTLSRVLTRGQHSWVAFFDLEKQELSGHGGLESGILSSAFRETKGVTALQVMSSTDAKQYVGSRPRESFHTYHDFESFSPLFDTELYLLPHGFEEPVAPSFMDLSSEFSMEPMALSFGEPMQCVQQSASCELQLL